MELIRTEASTINDLKQLMEEQNLKGDNLRITGRIG